MNFFGHAVLAAARNDDPRFVLGSMLPDLAPMAGLRIERVRDPVTAAGIAFHHATDGVFHLAPIFNRLLIAGSSALQEAGVRRGPALGTAHVGLELLLDGWIAAHHGVPAHYRAALDGALAIAADIEFSVRANVHTAHPFHELCQRVSAAPLPDAYARAGFTAERVERALASRPRLALEGGERAHVERWAATAGPAWDTHAPPLLAEVEAELMESSASRTHVSASERFS